MARPMAGRDKGRLTRRRQAIQFDNEQEWGWIMMRPILLGGLLVALMGCAGSSQPFVYEPLVDTARPGFNQQQYLVDLQQCRQYADQQNVAGGAAVGTLGGAAGGAALGAVGGAIAGDAGEGAAIGAATGAIVGLVGGTAYGVSRQQEILDNCLIGRGYNIL